MPGSGRGVVASSWGDVDGVSTSRGGVGLSSGTGSSVDRAHLVLA